MKRTYVTPSIEMETFAPNEYIAACYAIVDVNNSSNFAIKGGWDGQYTDGINNNSNGRYNWPGNGFQDDNFDYLDTTWGESTTGLFYDGPGMSHSTNVKTWEGNNDRRVGETLVDHVATQVNIVELTEANSSTYNSSPNAS